MKRGCRCPPPDRLAVATERELHAARRISRLRVDVGEPDRLLRRAAARAGDAGDRDGNVGAQALARAGGHRGGDVRSEEQRLNSSHEWISYAVFCLKKKKESR